MIVDFWGLVIMCMVGEEFVMVLYFLGVKFVWDEGLERVLGVEILLIVMFDCFCIDVILCVLGLFCDVFLLLFVFFL